MTHSLSKLALAAVTASVGAALIAGCGNDVPAGSVAKVGDETITKSEFDKWLKTAAAGASQGGQAVVPDPPNYTKCVAAKKQQPTQTGAKPSDAQAEKLCKQEYDQLKNEVMQFLIQSEWVEQEAAARDVGVSDQEVKRSFEDQKKQAFPSDKAYKKFLASSGMSEEDILFRVKLDQLQQKLTQKVTEDEGKVTNADVRDYYEKNRRRFAQPERRDLNVVLTTATASRTSPRSTRSTRPPSRRAASCPTSPRGSRRRPWTPRSSRPRRARSRGPSRRSSATTSSRSRRSSRQRSSR
jgi:foldase protein PrsA